MATYNAEGMYVVIKNNGSKLQPIEIVDKDELNHYTNAKLYKIMKITALEPVTVNIVIS